MKKLVIESVVIFAVGFVVTYVVFRALTVFLGH